MKRIICWFRKRTVNKLLIVLFAVCTIVSLIVGKLWVALIEFTFFTMWIGIDMYEAVIDAKEDTVSLLYGALKCNLEKSSINLRYGILWKHKYFLANAKVDFINGKIDAKEFGKIYNTYAYVIEQDLKNIKEEEKKGDAV